MHIGHILNLKGWSVISLAPGSKVSDAAALLAKENIGIAVVKESDGALKGVISERDIIRGISLHGVDLLNMPIDELMSTEVLTVSPDISVRDVLQIMAANEFRHLPITEDDEVVGVISMRDVVDTRLAELETENDNLRQLLTEAVGDAA